MSILQLGKVLAKPLLKKVFKSQGAKVGGYVIGGAAAVFGGTVGYQKVSECNEDRQNHELFSKKEEIWEDQNISLLDRTWRTVKSLFSDQDVESKSRKYLEDEYTNDPEKLQEAGRKYTKELLGPDIKNLTPKAKEKRYREALREFYMQLTSLGLDQERSEQILAGAIGELQADTRSRAVKDFISLGANTTSINNRARFAQQCARYNLTNYDAFGNAPSEDDAMEYQHATFSNMNEIGIQQSLGEIRQTFLRYKYLSEKEARGETLSKEEAQELKEFNDIVLNNCVIKGYAASYTGISINNFVSDEFVTDQLKAIFNETCKYGIQNQVLDSANKFVTNNEKEFSNLPNGRGDFKTLMDSATGGQYSEYLRTGSVTGGGGDIEGSSGTAYKALGDRTGNPARSTGGSGENNIAETDPGAAPRLSENSDADGDEPLAQKHLNPENAPVTNPNRTAYNVENVFAKYAQLSGSNINKNIERAVNIGSVPLIKKTISEAGLSPQAAFMALAATQSKDKKVLALAIEYFNQMDSKLKSASFVQVSETWQLNLFQIMSVSEVMAVNLDDCELPPDQLTLLKEMQQKKVEENHMEGVYKERLQR